MWEPSHKVDYLEPEELSRQYTELAEEYSKLLSRIESITKLQEQTVKILLSYNPKIAEQLNIELEKINDKADDKGDEPTSDSSGQ